MEKYIILTEIEPKRKHYIQVSCIVRVSAPIGTQPGTLIRTSFSEDMHVSESFEDVVESIKALTIDDN